MPRAGQPRHRICFTQITYVHYTVQSARLSVNHAISGRLIGLRAAMRADSAGAHCYLDLRDASKPIQSVVMSAGVRPAIRLACPIVSG